MACAALFTLFVSLLRRFESAKIERWSKVRYVIDRPGLWLSKDAKPLCTNPTQGVLLLSNGTMVESLERRACGGDQLLDPGAAPSAGSWTLERVKVLNGSDVGVEGWVSAYGLLETIRP
jgi:hypothetical protein